MTVLERLSIFRCVWALYLLQLAVAVNSFEVSFDHFFSFLDRYLGNNLNFDFDMLQRYGILRIQMVYEVSNDVKSQAIDVAKR